MLSFDIKFQNKDMQLTAPQIMMQINRALSGTDKSVQSITPDGYFANVQQGEQVLQVPLQNIMGSLGAEVKRVAPTQGSVKFDRVSPRMRYAITNLETDDARRNYIKSALERQGMEVGQIVGSGRDWYAYDPSQGEYIALTNSPEWEMADAAEALTHGGRLTGSILGTVAGAVAGPFGSMGGAALGTAGAEALTRGIAAATDEDYRDAFSAEDALLAGGMQTAIAGAIPGLATGIRAGAPVILGRTVGSAATAPMSAATQAVGGALEGVGKVAGAAELGASQTGRVVGTALTPGLGRLQLMGMIGQAPRYITEKASQGAQWLGKKLGVEEAVARNVGGEGVTQIAENVARGFGATGARVAAKIRGATPSPRVEELITRKGAEAAARGRDIGQTAQKLSDVGAGAQSFAEGTFGGIMSGAAGVGRVARSAGETISGAASRAAPHELGAYMQGIGRAPSVDRPNLLHVPFRSYNEDIYSEGDTQTFAPFDPATDPNVIMPMGEERPVSIGEGAAQAPRPRIRRHQMLDY